MLAPDDAGNTECDRTNSDRAADLAVAELDAGSDDADGGDIEFAEATPELIAERDGVDITSYRLPPCPRVFRHPLLAFAWTARAIFGIVSLILLLAVIAAIPIVNFLALGYLLEVEARVARTGRLRDAFLLLDVAPRIGSITLGVWLWLIPLRLIGTARRDAWFIDPDGEAYRSWATFASVAAVLIGTHICLALARGGSLPCFVRPIKNIRWLRDRWRRQEYLTHATAGIQDFVRRLRIKHHFLLGAKGFAGAFIWLAVPSAMLAAARPDRPLLILIRILGGASLVVVLSWLPFLQGRFAVTGRWKSMFELRTIRDLYHYAPIAWFLSLLVVYVLALPLYLPKVFLLPSDARWLITIVFIITIYPARVFTGWALHRAAYRERKPWFGFRWISRTLILPLLSLYVFLLFFTPLITEHGRGVLFEHHALLLPAP